MPESGDDTPVLAAIADGQEAVLAPLFARSPLAQAVVDRTGRLRRANPVLRRLVGEGCVLDATAHVTTLFMPAARPDMWAALQSVLDGGDSAEVGRGVALAPSGARVDVLATAIREADGRTSGLLLHVRDAGERALLEARLAQALEPGGIDQRAGVVAHDVNNLLSVILATVSDALARPGLEAAVRGEFHGIGDAARRASAVVRSLLDGGPQTAPMALGIDAVLRALATPLRRALGGVTLAVVPGQPDAAVRIDPEHLDRVLMNLALNARHAMPSGGVLTVRSSQCDVTETVSQFGEAVLPGRYVVVSVCDTGTGIPASVMPRLFEPFFTTRADSGGTGLGLASVRDLVRQAGGFLSVESKPGRGTTVRVHLPRHGAAPWHEGVAPEDRASAGSSRLGSVLLVDDEPVLLRLAERALSRAGWRVLAASSTAAALAAAQDADPPPCLLVADMVLPDRDGLALVGEMRLLFPGLPAILTSGYAGEAMRGQAAAAGTVFLAKPYGMAALLEEVAIVLQPPR